MIAERRSPPLRRLFQPGQGAPPYLAGRKQELARLGDLLASVTIDRRAPSQDAVLIGPRGNGKTTLLGAFGASCRAGGARVLRANPSVLENKPALAGWLLDASDPALEPDPPDATSAWTRMLRGVVQKGKRWQADAHRFSVPGFYSSQWKKTGLALHQLPALLLQQCKQRPRVALLDEAHTLNTEVGRLLLNVSQEARNQGAPFLLVLAGTPNLRHHLGAMNSTFWSRCARIGVGRLSEEATRQALLIPLGEYGILLESNALAQVVEESQCYPYFIQCWGQALCENLLATGPAPPSRIDAGIVAAARLRFESQRTDYYGDRRLELDERELLPIAKVVAEALLARNKMEEILLRRHVVERMGISDPEAREALEQLKSLGYLWEPPGLEQVEPGIPSLMRYVFTYGATQENRLPSEDNLPRS